MSEENKEYYSALRAYVADYQSRSKWFIPLLVIWIGGALVASRYPAVGTVAMLALATLIYNSYILGRTRCPRCSGHFMTHMFAAFSFTSKALAPGNMVCTSCGLKVSVLPEVESTHHGDE